MVAAAVSADGSAQPGADASGPVAGGILPRMERLLQSADKSSRIIEIGPGYSPVAAKAAGWNAHVVDHTSRDGLREKYAKIGVDLDAVEEVDSIWSDGALHDAVPVHLHGTFDMLIASHLIEHVPDFVGFLTSAESLVGPGGVLSLAVPDRRYCFDYFKSPTMTGDVLEAHYAGRSRHSLRTAWNSFAYGVTLNGLLAVGQLPIEKTAFMSGFAVATTAWATFKDDPHRPYQDHHAWYFTPAGFALIILELGQIGLIDWRIRSLHGPEGFEFFVSLERGADRVDDAGALQARRMALLRKLHQESQEQVAPAIDRACGTEASDRPGLTIAAADPGETAAANAPPRRGVRKMLHAARRFFRGGALQPAASAGSASPS